MLDDRLVDTEPTVDVRDRTVRLFSFLQEFVELQSRIIRHTDQYEKTFWLHELPSSSGCYSVFHDKKPTGDEEAWIEVERPNKLSPPPPPAQLEPWINQNHINDAAREFPQLLEKTPNPAFDNFDQSDEPEYLDLKDCRSEISQMWEQYVEHDWWPWAEEERKKYPVSKVYSDLFSLYQRQHKLGESYEVVLGIGCLQWKTPSGNSIKRHLVTAQINLRFDKDRSVIAIGPAGEGANFTFEQNMLDAAERIGSDDLDSLELSLRMIDDTSIEQAELDKILRSWLKQVSDSATYSKKLEPAKTVTEKPKMSFAPAIILRRRTDRSLLNCYAEIISQLNAGNSVPPGLQSLVSIIDAKSGEPTISDDTDDPENEESDIKNDVYFPLPSNQEQRQIVERMRDQHGVLVQGPPGTGKSHTIANLISHLLASGKRVLVTSHTARALTVLQAMVPPELSALSVVLLGDDMQSLESLEESVKRITEESRQYDPKRSQAEIEELENRLVEERLRESDILEAMRSLREVETYHHPLTLRNYIHQLEAEIKSQNGQDAQSLHGLRQLAAVQANSHPLEDAGYTGTLQGISARLREDESKYGWLIDRPAEDREPPLSAEEFKQFVQLLSEISPEDEKMLKLTVVDPAVFLDPQSFLDLRELELNARQKYEKFVRAANQLEYPSLPELDETIQQELLAEVSRVLDTYENLRNHILPWVKKAAHDIVSDNHAVWQTLLKTTSEQIEYISERLEPLSSLKVTGLSGMDLKTVRRHASRLLGHLKQTGNIGFGPFRPKIVREAMYIVDRIRVDGQVCDRPRTLEKLIHYLDILQRFDSLSALWSQYTETPDDAPLSIRLSEFKNLHDGLISAFKLHNDVSQLKDVISKIPGMSQPVWNQLNAIRYLRESIIGLQTERQYRSSYDQFKKLEQVLLQAIADPDVHPILNKMLYHVRDRNHAGYTLELENLKTIWRQQERFHLRTTFVNRLADAAPQLLGKLLETFADAAWSQRAIEFETAWNWARADSWRQRISSPKRQEMLANELRHQQENIRKILTRLTAAKAWAHCFERMTEHERQHLIAWSKAVRNLGKGTGKYASVHRRAARENMEQCMTAIPAWVMPVYRAVETIRPTQEMFDVVIVDEASQSGPEALFLLYLAKQIVVVGDEKQISPYFIGISRDDVEGLRQKYLMGIPHNESIGVENSFFDHAEIRYGNPVRLREHFRCMPEIIQFSNQNFYGTHPLVPLRQFGANRLSPVIQTHHVIDGAAENDANGIVNEAEARSIVNTIRQCVKDVRYSGKSFGVISLQGTAQARFIETILLKEIGPDEMDARNLVCGDAYAFQGDERDVIFLSMVVGTNKRFGTLSKPADERRFNVAMSRSRDQVWLFHSVTIEDLSKNCLRHKTLEYCQEPQTTALSAAALTREDLLDPAALEDRSRVVAPHPFENWFEVDVYLILTEKGYKVTPKYQVGAHAVDLVVEGENRCMAIECDGESWNGLDQYDEEIRQQQILERCGWVFQRIRGGEFYRNPEEALASLWEKMEELGIEPAIVSGNGEMVVAG